MAGNDENSPDGDTLAGLLRGEAEAIDRWFRRDHPRIFRLSFGLLGDFQEAEDLASEAMVRILDRLDSRDPSRSFRAWSNTLVINLGRDRLRRLKARPKPAAMNESALTDTLPADPGGLEQEELRGLIERALSRLSTREREVFVLRELEAVPTGEVAETLKITESSVRSLLTLARRRLRDLLDRRLADPGSRS